MLNTAKPRGRCGVALEHVRLSVVQLTASVGEGFILPVSLCMRAYSESPPRMRARRRAQVERKPVYFAIGRQAEIQAHAT
jgi:hypothetical protein